MIFRVEAECLAAHVCTIPVLRFGITEEPEITRARRLPMTEPARSPSYCSAFVSETLPMKVVFLPISSEKRKGSDSAGLPRSGARANDGFADLRYIRALLLARVRVRVSFSENWNCCLLLF